MVVTTCGSVDLDWWRSVHPGIAGGERKITDNRKILPQNRFSGAPRDPEIASVRSDPRDECRVQIEPSSSTVANAELCLCDLAEDLKVAGPPESPSMVTSGPALATLRPRRITLVQPTERSPRLRRPDRRAWGACECIS